MEPRGHLRTAPPEFMQQMLWLKVYTNRDRQPRVTVPTTTMTNTIPCSYIHVTLPCTRLSYAFKSNVRLACGNPSFPFPDSCLHLQTHTTETVEEFVYLFRAPKVVQPNKCRCSAPALSRRKQSREPPSLTANLGRQAEPLCWWEAAAEAGAGHRALGGCPDASVPSPRSCSVPPRLVSWWQMPFSDQQSAGKNWIRSSKKVEVPTQCTDISWKKYYVY